MHDPVARQIAAREAICDVLDAASILSSDSTLTLFRTITPEEVTVLEQGSMPATLQDAISIPIGRMLAEGVIARLPCLHTLMDYLELHRLVDQIPEDPEFTPAKARVAGPELLAAIVRIREIIATGKVDEVLVQIDKVTNDALRCLRRAAPE